MTPHRSHTLSLFALLCLAACDPVGADPDGGPTFLDGGPPEVAIGTGADAFVPFEDGDTLDLVPGCQGSQHVWIALRGQGLALEEGPIIELSLVRDADEVLVSQIFRVRVSFDRVPGTAYADVSGLTLVVPEPEMALGEDLTVRATVTDMNEVEVTDERPIRIQWAEEGPCGPATG